MINLDEEEIIQAINDVLGRDSRRGLRKLVRLELTKTEKFENRLLCLCDYRIFLITISKNNKPNKVESMFHFFDVKKIESHAPNHVIFCTSDKEFRLHSIENFDSNDFESNEIDEILHHYCNNLFDIFPSVTIRDLIETVNIQPEKRLVTIYKDINDSKYLRKKLNLCDSYSKAYTVCCDYNSVCFYQEAVWDVNVIYGKNSLNEFSLNDFDYVSIKDFYPLIWALRHNKWFESFHSEGVKLSNEMQEELIKVLVLPTCNFKKLTLIQSNIKAEFFNKLQNYFCQIKAKQSSQLLPISNTITNLRSINFSRNSIEDRGLVQFINLFKNHETSSTHSNLLGIYLSKCSISSKSINTLFSTINLYLLNTLDLSFNNLKDEPTDFFKYLSEPNQLVELNLTSTDIDIEKLFNSLGKGGCDTCLKKLILNNNTSFHKLVNTENLIKFLLNSKVLAHLEVSSCKLPASLAQVILSSLKHNQNINGLHLNLASNDLGPNIKSFMYDFNQNYVIKSVDLSDNNLDSDTDLLIAQMHHTSIKSISLNKNFQYSKSKLLTRVMHSLIKWLVSEANGLEQLWLIDCRLKSSLNDLISEMGEFKKLRLLDISGNDLGDFGINLLSKSLQVNRSLETLIFDRSNISIASYQRIQDSLKRNFTLKTIQMPINDICILYQKSPDKVVDIVKQMTDTLSQRSLLKSEQKCDLNQLFKTKMKLINESASLSSSQQLNISFGSHSSSSTSSLLPQQSPGQIKKSGEIETDSDSTSENQIDFNNQPGSTKEVLQYLNESANCFLTNNSVEKCFKQLNESYLEKLDNLVIDLERELVNKLKKSYPKYSSSIHQYSLNSNQSNSQQYTRQSTIEADIAKLKNTIREYTNSMMIQMHNDLCELSYNLSLSMSEKVMLESKTQLDKKVNCQTDPPNKQINSNLLSETSSAVEMLGKKIAGGVRLPFANITLPTSPISETTPCSVQQRIESMNSKTKRPISSQIYETPVVQNPNESPSKHLSSSSNENLIENSSDDDLLDENKSREKTPDSLKSDNLDKTPVISEFKKETPESIVPTPAPRKSKNLVKSLFGNLGVGQKITSPKLGRKVIEPKETEQNLKSLAPMPVVEAKSEEIADTNEDLIRPLQHINKSRPKRANIKKPTVKNPSASLETELTGRDNMDSLHQENEPVVEITNAASPPQPSTGYKHLLFQGEQIKIDKNILGNIKLRKTIRNKSAPEEPENAQPAPTLASTKLSNRLSIFEKKDEKNVRKLDEMGEILEEDGKHSKPLPPIPPHKPPRPAFGPGKSSEAPTINHVKLRPVSTINNSTNLITNSNKLGELNGIKLNVNNSAGTTSTSSISSSSASSVADSKISSKENLDNDKRSSVKEIVQMWSDESKA